MPKTHRRSTGPKLFPVHVVAGRFEDIKRVQREHERDLRKKPAVSVLGCAPVGWTCLEIPDVVPPSNNELKRKYRHWAVYRLLRETWAWYLKIAIMRIRPAIATGKHVGETRPKMSVNVTVYRTRKLDSDNLRGGMKPVWDAMRDVGLIRNDSPKWLDDGVSQLIGSPRTVIEFRETTNS